jgi:hypothetical protein
MILIFVCLQEINKLQFELEYRQSTLMESQQTWAQRFDKWAPVSFPVLFVVRDIYIFLVIRFTGLPTRHLMAGEWRLH